MIPMPTSISSGLDVPGADQQPETDRPERRDVEAVGPARRGQALRVSEQREEHQRQQRVHDDQEPQALPPGREVQPASDREKDVDRLGHLALDVQGGVGVGVAVAVIPLVGRPRGSWEGPAGAAAAHEPGADRTSMRRTGPCADPSARLHRLGDREPGDRLTVQQRGRLADALVDPAAVRPDHPGMLAGDGRLGHQDIVVGRAADPDQLSGLENVGLAVNLEMELAGRAHRVAAGRLLDVLSGGPPPCCPAVRSGGPSRSRLGAPAARTPSPPARAARTGQAASRVPAATRAAPEATPAGR